MSEKNIEILRGIYSEMGRGNFWALGPFLDQEVEWIWAPNFQGIVGEKVFHGPKWGRSGDQGVVRSVGAVHAGGGRASSMQVTR